MGTPFSEFPAGGGGSGSGAGGGGGNGGAAGAGVIGAKSGFGIPGGVPDGTAPGGKGVPSSGANIRSWKSMRSSTSNPCAMMFGSNGYGPVE